MSAGHNKTKLQTIWRLYIAAAIEAGVACAPDGLLLLQAHNIKERIAIKF